MEEKEKNINFKFRKESDVPKYIEMVQEQQKELFKFCIKLMKKGYTEIPIEEIPTFQRLTAEDFFWYVKEVYRSDLPLEEKNEALEQILISKGVPEKWAKRQCDEDENRIVCLYMGRSNSEDFINKFQTYYELSYVQACYSEFERRVQAFYLKTLGEYQKWLCEKNKGKQKMMHSPKKNY